MRFLVDENLSSGWCESLRKGGHEAEHWLEVGSTGAPDNEVFERAALTRAIILTQDLDFARLLAQYGTALPSVIQIRISNPAPTTTAPSVLAVAALYEAELVAGCLISLEPNSHRLRLLPIRKE